MGLLLQSQAPESRLWKPGFMILGRAQESAFSETHPGDAGAEGPRVNLKETSFDPKPPLRWCVLRAGAF